MTVTRLQVHRDRYRDSLLLLGATAAMSGVDGVGWAGAVMATPSGRSELVDGGVDAADLTGLSGNDLVLAVRARDDAVASAALDVGAGSAFPSGAEAGDTPSATISPRSITEASRLVPGLNLAIVSVPGPYAALEAHHALSGGLHVLLFSDNVPLEEEIELKRRAAALGLLVMGPGAGTAIVAGTGLGFANVVRRGPVGVIAAAGTGAQEVSCLLDRWGVGVSHVIGVGGRDLSEPVGGEMARLAARTLARDSDTRALLLVSKPPAPSAVRAVLDAAGDVPTAATLIGLDDADTAFGGRSRLFRASPTLEQGARAAARLVGVEPPTPADGLAERVARSAGRLADRRRLIRGLFSGGTLCYEAQVIISRTLGPVYSNEPLGGDRVPAPPGSHVCLDLGAEEYTQGRPHPMIDPSSRMAQLAELPSGPEAEEIAVVLIDVVLGYGAHADPAGTLAPVLADVMADGGPQVVAYVLGTDGDPQGYRVQRRVLEDVGCVVTQTAARAAFAAAAIAGRDPALAESDL